MWCRDATAWTTVKVRWGLTADAPHAAEACLCCPGCASRWQGDRLFVAGSDLDLTIRVDTQVKGNEDGVCVLPVRTVTEITRERWQPFVRCSGGAAWRHAQPSRASGDGDIIERPDKYGGCRSSRGWASCHFRATTRAQYSGTASSRAQRNPPLTWDFTRIRS